MTGAHAAADRPADVTTGRTDPSARPPRSPGSGGWSDDVDEMVRGTRGAEEVAASLIGRWPRSRLLHQYQLPSLDEPGRTLLQRRPVDEGATELAAAGGVVLHRTGTARSMSSLPTPAGGRTRAASNCCGISGPDGWRPR